MTDRKPDYVFNVWGNGVVTLGASSAAWTAREMAEVNKLETVPCLMITHRIRVFMKEKRS